MLENAVQRSLSAEQYRAIRSLLRQATGINLGENKMALAESRLLKRLNALGVPSFGRYLEILRHHPEELQQFICTMTTNKTDWFREPSHFDYLRDHVLGTRKASSSEPWMIWSAASSTGEEAYSIAITLEEAGVGTGAYRILGTDVNPVVLKKAESAFYRSPQVQEQVSPPTIRRWFEPGVLGGEAGFRVSAALRRWVKFRRFNLIESSLAVPMRFDAIFLRNVLIYFDLETTQKVIQGIARYLRPGGYLFLGHSETLNGIAHPFRVVGSAVYRK